MGQANVKQLPEGPIFWEIPRVIYVTGPVAASGLIDESAAIQLRGLYALNVQLSGNFAGEPIIEIAQLNAAATILSFLRRVTLGATPFSSAYSVTQIVLLDQGEKIRVRVSAASALVLGDWITGNINLTYLGSNF